MSSLFCPECLTDVCGCVARKLSDLERENKELKQKLEVAKKALGFYANWANYNSEGSVAHWDSEKVTTLGEIDHKTGFICGKTARQALKEIGE